VSDLLRDPKARDIVGICDQQGRHTYVHNGDPIAEVQRRVNATVGTSDEPKAADLDAIAAWFDRQEGLTRPGELPGLWEAA
jgi:hypothetical protein